MEHQWMKIQWLPVPNDCVVPQIWWSYVPFHKADTFSGEQPSTIQDFFDVEKFPGKRGVHTWGNGIVEMALYAEWCSYSRYL